MSDSRFMFVVLMIAILAPFASDSYLPSLPHMTEHFGSTEAMMQFSITIYFFGLGITQLFWGPLSDKMGRKHALQLGCWTALIGCAIAGFATSPWMLILGRFIQGAGGAANSSLFRAIMRDRYSGKKLSEVGSYVGMFFALIPSVAPIIGGFIQSAFFWQANFIFLFFLTAFVLFIISRMYVETNVKLNAKALHLDQFINNYKELLSHKPFLGFVAASSAALSGIIAYFTISTFLLQNQLGLSSFQYGLTAIFITVGMISGQFINTQLIHRLGIHKMLLISFGLMFFSGSLLMIFSLLNILSVASVCIPTLFFVMGSGLAFSNASAGAFQPFGHIAGSAGAMFGCLQILGTTLTTFIVALFPENTSMVLAVTFVSLSVLGFIGYTLLANPAADSQ